jgi:two-component system alkaline phosphatase synthesis response regulator PhoP
MLMSEAKRVLLIDDDPDFVAAIEALLESAGFEVQSAADGREGLRQAKTGRPDLILLDVMMTERTEGFFTLQELRRIPALAHTPVIVISSIYTEEPVFRVSPEAGWLPADLFLAKPVDPARLLNEVRRLLGRSETIEAPAAGGGGDL